ncbi:hypothetical protein ACSBR2_013144 [Camellia fascicularis]
MSCGKESGETDEIYECNFEDILDVSKKIKAPKVEMTFGSKDEAHQYYASYAREEGFEVMIRSSRQGDNETGGHEHLSFTEKDCRNYIEKMRRLRLGTGNAEAILTYFTKMQNKNSSFFYVKDLDDDGRLQNVFWAVARSRAAYESFGDVVSFDSTYLTKKYDMPFALFVRIYTMAKFKEFQNELRGLIYCNVSFVKQEGCIFTFEVEDNVKVGDSRKQDLRRRHSFIKCSYNDQETNEQVQRYDKLCSYFYEIAAKSEEKCNHLMSYLSEIKAKMQKTDDQFIKSQCPSLSPCNEEFNEMSKPCTKVLSPLPLRAKGCSPSKRKESKIDQLVRKKKDCSKKFSLANDYSDAPPYTSHLSQDSMNRMVGGASMYINYSNPNGNPTQGVPNPFWSGCYNGVATNIPSLIRNHPQVEFFKSYIQVAMDGNNSDSGS